MLIMRPTTFYSRGLYEIGTIEEPTGPSRRSLAARQAMFSPFRFSPPGCPLRRSGHVGAGHNAGIYSLQDPLWVRRLVTITPALVVLAIGLDPTRTLVISRSSSASASRLP